MGTSIGTVQAVFLADTKSFDASLGSSENRLKATAFAAEQAAGKIAAAGEKIDRTAVLQQKAADRARAAWQRELLQQDRAAEAQAATGRAAELAALKLDILTRSAASAAESEGALATASDAAAGAGMRMQNSIGLVDNVIRGQASKGLADLIRRMSGVGVVMDALPWVAAAAGVFLVGRLALEGAEKIFGFGDAADKAQQKFQEDWIEIQKSVRDVNDELTLSNARIGDSISELEQTPGNGLKTALLETAGAAEKFGEKLDEDIKKARELLSADKVSALGKMFGDPREGIGQTINSAIGQYQKIAPDYEDVLQRASSAGKWSNYLDVRKDEIAALHAAIDPEIATLKDYLRQNQPLRGEKGSAGWNEAAQGYTLLTGIFSDLDSLAQSERQQFQKGKLQISVGSAKVAATAFAKVLETEMKAVPERIKLMVDTPTKEREERDRVFKSMLGSPSEPAGGFRDVAGEMDQDIGRYGPRWREYNDLIAKGATEQEKLQMQLALTKIRIEAATGAIGPHAAALAEAKERAGEYALNLETLQEELRGILSDQSLTSNERDTQAQRVRNQIGDLNGQNQIQAAQDQALIASTEALNEFRESLLRTANSWTNLGEVGARFVEGAIGGVNSTIMKLLSTPANMMRGKHPWGDLGASVAKSAGTSALQYGEGEVMKALGLGKKGDGYHVFVDNMPGGPIGSGGVPGLLSLFGGASSTRSPSPAAGGGASSIASFALSAAGLPHFAMGGAIPSNMPAIVGENGAELWMPSNPGRIIPNGEFGGGGDTHVHVDARGNNDPAATNAAVHRAMQSYLPHLPRMAIAAQADRNNRLPSSRRSR